MPILQDATDEQLARLLELFPVAHARTAWPEIKERKKEALCAMVAARRDYNQIGSFVEAHFSCAKQHVYIFDRPVGAITLPDVIRDGERIRQPAAARSIYLSRLVRGVMLQAPLEHATITFLWPVKVETTATNIIVRFVVLERNVTAYFNRTAYPAERGIEEVDILASIVSALPDINLTRCDLHKGVKKLWADEFMDAFRTGYKTAKFAGTVKMHEEKGIRENEPAMYKTLMKSPLSEMTFRVAKNRAITSVDALSIDPGAGTLSFHRYSEAVGDTDRVIREILRNN